MVLTDKIRKRLFDCADPGYAEFILRLTPGLDRETVIGVRSPELRRICRSLDGAEAAEFMKELPHKYLEENNLHSMLISRIKDEDACIEALEAFLPYIDNWATCDTVSPAVFKKKREKLLARIRVWISTDRVYTVRAGVGMLMKYFLDDAFSPEYNDLVAGIVSDEYYVNMMCAWYFATALAKQYGATEPYLRDRRLTEQVRKMTLKKANESFRIPDERKKRLKELR